ncbi:MAG: DUF2062 domain-containing protein [Kiritimatiellae bacterium]|nr:DUF2062 domain-containing protein [Kiritimatiellia bacterium]
MKHGLRNGRLHRLLGDRIFHSSLWSFDQRSVAGGLALGLFVAFTPTFPFQMLLCAIGAILLGVNLSVSQAAIWITNPLTAIPIYLAAIKVGRFLCQHTLIGGLTTVFFSLEGRTGKVMRESLYLWTGCLVFAGVSAILGYVAVNIVWSVYRWRTGKGRRRERTPGRPVQPGS